MTMVVCAIAVARACNHRHLDGDTVYDHDGACANVLTSASTTIDDGGVIATTEMPPGYGHYGSSTLALVAHLPSTLAASPRCSVAPKGSILPCPLVRQKATIAGGSSPDP
jgi:hypothetical protein